MGFPLGERLQVRLGAADPRAIGGGPDRKEAWRGAPVPMAASAPRSRR